MKTLKQLNRLKNTRVITWNDDKCGRCYLHGSLIIEWDEQHIFMSLCGWNTVTTRRRIKQVLDILDVRIGIFTKKYEPYMYVNGHLYDINSRSLYCYKKTTGEIWMVVNGCAIPMIEQS